MNEQLIKFIELCLMDGVITDKEKEVIFRKSKELGVPEDECEIILEGMIEQNKKNSPSPKITTETSSSTSSEEENISQYDDKKEEGELDENGNRIGIWRLYSDDKNWEEGEYDENGNKTGVWKSCFQDKINLEIPYVKGKKDGEVINHMNREPFVYEKYKNDILVYQRFNYSDSNNIMILNEYDDFGKQISYTNYSLNGKIESETKFENGLKSTSKNYDNDGKLMSENFYDENEKTKRLVKYDNDGEIKDETLLDENGKIKRLVLYNDDGNPTGYEDFYDENGKIKRTVEDNDDGKIKGETFYDENGKRKRRVKYDNDGEPRLEYIYENGKIITSNKLGKEKTEEDKKEKQRLKDEEKKKKQNLEKKKNLEKEFLSSVVFPNIVNSKSKFYELLLDKDFYVEFEYFDETFVLSLNDPMGSGYFEDELPWSRFKSFYLPQFIQKIKLFVFINLFSNNDFFRLLRNKNIPDSVKDLYRLELKSPVSKKNVDNTTVGEHEFGIYIDKNGWLFNPSRDSIIFYINENNIFNCDLGNVKSISTSPFLKGGMFSKSVIKLKQMSVCLKNGVKSYQSQDVSIEIKSKKLFKETETRYTNWIKFLFTLKDFENQLIGLRRKNLSNSNQELYEFLKGFSKVELNNYVKKVREVLNTNKDEIESKEKEFNSNFIQDFIKIINFVESNIDNYWSMNISICSQIDINIKKGEFLDYNEIEKITKSHNKFISLNSTIIFGLIEMIRSVIYNDRIRFYEIYEKFDKLRIFNSQYQNDVINSLSSINQNLIDLNSKIDNLTNTIEMMSDQILSSINELKFEVSYLNDNITGQLQSISSKLDVNNLLNMVQTYQLYRINSNTKSLRS